MPPHEDTPRSAPHREIARSGEASPLADALGSAVRKLWSRGRQEVERAAMIGRVRLEIRQLQRDRDQFWIRLGKTAYRLAESGDIENPALTKAMRRLDEIETRIRHLEQKYGPQPAEGDDDQP